MNYKSYAKLLISVAALSLFAVGCSNEDSAASTDGSATSHSITGGTGGGATAHGAWSYEGATGPAHWAELSPEYAIAGTGREQSPIDIKTADLVKKPLPPLNYYYDDANVFLFNNGHTIQANIENGTNFLTIGTKRFDLAQFHFHTSSENSVDGAYAPIEMHMVHKSASGELAVVGVFFSEGEENETLEELWKDLPDIHEDGHYCSEEIEIGELLPENRTSYRFDGSLTTPPCTEGVKWTVMANEQHMSAEQISDFVKIFSGAHFPEGNRRPVQPVYDREIVLDVDYND